MKEKSRLERAKAKLMLTHPFFGALSTTLDIEKSDDIESIYTKDNKLLFNNEYINTLNDDELSFILANASLHQNSIYKKRGVKKIDWLWDLAVDYTINSILVANDLPLPPKLNYDSYYDDMYAEEIYEDLKSKIKDLKEQEEDQDYKAQNENLLDDLIDQIIQKHKDSLPRGIERLVEFKSPPKLDWKALLFRYINNSLVSDFRFNPPNKKFLYQNIALPRVYGESLEIAVAIDTSSSIDEELLDLFLSEFSAIMQSFDSCEILFIECDEKIRSVRKLYASDDLSTTLKGGGGTDFRPVFDYLQKDLIDLKTLIYFTDGEGIYPDFMPQIETLWIMPRYKEPPFGEVITFSLN